MSRNPEVECRQSDVRGKLWHQKVTMWLDSAPSKRKDFFRVTSGRHEILVSLALLTAVCVFFSSRPAAPQEQQWLFYSPALSRLEGKLTKVMKYGSPSYGEHPEQDQKIDVPILILQFPVRVKSPPASSVNTQTTNVSFVQLIFPRESGSYSKHLNANIVVEGTLAKGIKGEHFTDVVMTVKRVNPVDPPVY
jgi:hypothetical protein